MGKILALRKSGCTECHGVGTIPGGPDEYGNVTLTACQCEAGRKWSERLADYLSTVENQADYPTPFDPLTFPAPTKWEPFTHEMLSAPWAGLAWKSLLEAGSVETNSTALPTALNLLSKRLGVKGVIEERPGRWYAVRLDKRPPHAVTPWRFETVPDKQFPSVIL